MQEQVSWRVSSYSANVGNCVEIGTARNAVVVRDTKNREAGALRVSSSAWRTFTASLNR